MASQQPLTTYLTLSCPRSLALATTHPFLRVAGSGHLPKPKLSQWLSQDRIYAQNYVRFIGHLLSKIHLSPSKTNTTSKISIAGNTNSSYATIEERTFDILTDALVNIRRELRFFDDVAAEYGLDLNAISAEEQRERQQGGSGSWRDPDECGHHHYKDSGKEEKTDSGFRYEQEEVFELARSCAGAGSAPGVLRMMEGGCSVFFGPNRVTRAYVDMFMSAGSSGVTLLEGMVVLWATEVCYLQAWKYAATMGEEQEGASEKPRNTVKEEDADGGALREKFIPNWSSREFEDFVQRLAEVVDDMAWQVKGAEEGEMVRGRCLEWWRQVLWLEERFWPQVDDAE